MYPGLQTFGTWPYEEQWNWWHKHDKDTKSHIQPEQPDSSRTSLSYKMCWKYHLDMIQH